MGSTRRLALALVLTTGACGRPAATPANAPMSPGAGAELPLAPTLVSPDVVAKAAEPSEAMLAVEIVDLLFVPGSLQGAGGVVVLLRHPPEPGRLLPITIGDREGEAIARRMMSEPFVRPLTHDLLEKILERRDLRVLKVEIDALQDGTFLAQLFLIDMREGGVMKIDARPSDAIVLATGAGAAIYVARDVLEAAGEPYELWRDVLEGREPTRTPERESMPLGGSGPT